MEMFTHDFMIRALVAGLMVGSLCALLSVPVVLKKFAFMGVGISHSAFGGVAIGALMGMNVTYSALIYSIIVALGIGWLSRLGAVHEDVSIGIVFSMSMAIGVVALGMIDGYNIDLFTYLFGSILAVTLNDLILAGIVFVIVVGLLLLFYKEILLYCFDEEWARASGVKVDRLQDLLLVMIAITVVVSIKLLGIVLVAALLVIPGATGYMLAKEYYGQYIYSVLAAVISVLAGLTISYHFDIASGATIVLSAGVIFIVTAALTNKSSV